MKRFLTIGLLLGLPLMMFGKAAFYRKDAMIKQAEIIALVEISKVEGCKEKGRGWTYSEMATAKVERVLKGALPKNAMLYGGENFICAQVRYEPGRFLVFLQRDENLLSGVNWHLGVRPVLDDKIEWLADNESLNPTTQDLKTVLAEIEAAVAK